LIATAAPMYIVPEPGCLATKAEWYLKSTSLLTFCDHSLLYGFAYLPVADAWVSQYIRKIRHAG